MLPANLREQLEYSQVLQAKGIWNRHLNGLHTELNGHARLCNPLRFHRLCVFPDLRYSIIMHHSCLILHRFLRILRINRGLHSFSADCIPVQLLTCRILRSLLTQLS